MSAERADATAGRTVATGARNATIDVAGAALLSLIAGVGFHASFGGWRFLIPTIAAVGLGLAIGFAAARFKLPGLVVVAVGALAFCVVGPAFTIFGDTMFGLPTPRAFSEMTNGAVFGWSELLTVIPPAGKEGNLLVVPFVASYLAALLAILAALRTRSVGLPVVAPAVAFVLAVLWGTEHPAALLLQGCGYIVVAASWMGLRAARERAVIVNLGGKRRFVWAAGLILLMTLSAPAAYAHLPGTPGQRYVLRDHTDPPINPADFVSPLANYPSYSDKRAAKDKRVLFRVKSSEPFAKGTFFRLASMDAYDGMVFKVVADHNGGSGTFVKAGETLPDPPKGRTVDVRITIQDLQGVWLPVVGQPVSIDMPGDSARARELHDAVRFNRPTRALIAPGGTRAGDSYDLRIVPERDPAPAESTSIDHSVVHDVTAIPSPVLQAFMKSIADKAKKKQGDYARVEEMRRYLHDDAGFRKANDAAMHSLFRLELFAKNFDVKHGCCVVGTTEQFTAAMALAAREMGIPARTVVGFEAPNGTKEFAISHTDVRTWVEIPFVGVGWVRFDPYPKNDKAPDIVATDKPENEDSVPPESPPPAGPARPLVEDESEPRQDGQDENSESGKSSSAVISVALRGGSITLAIVLGAGASGLVVIALKRRRTRRRRSGPPVQQIAGAWEELVDRARDLGVPVSRMASREEAARVLGVAGAAELASFTDRAMFGSGESQGQDADDAWKQVGDAVAQLEADRSRPGRLAANLNLQSLIAARRRVPAGRR